jgi:hypothetical protein
MFEMGLNIEMWMLCGECEVRGTIFYCISLNLAKGFGEWADSFSISCEAACRVEQLR